MPGVRTGSSGSRLLIPLKADDVYLGGCFILVPPASRLLQMTIQTMSMRLGEFCIEQSGSTIK